MLLLISFFVFVVFVIFIIFIFSSKKKKNNKNTISNHQKIHFKFSILKNLYTEFDYEMNYDNSKKNT